MEQPKTEAPKQDFKPEFTTTLVVKKNGKIIESEVENNGK